MDINELEELLADLESDQSERKASLSDKETIRKNICAFANDLPNNNKPGYIFVGANDDGSCAHLEITDELLLNLVEMRSDILPFPSTVVEKKRVNGCELAVIEVMPHAVPPVRRNGRVWIRVGPSLRQASAEDERILTEKNRYLNIPPDLQVIDSAKFEDIDRKLFEVTYMPSAVAPDVLEQNQRSIEQQLASFRFVVEKDEELIPTALGVLIAGFEPRAYIPGAYIQFVRFDGLDLSDPIKDEKEFTGPIIDQLRMVEEILKLNISTSIDLTSESTERRLPDYPLVALQQIVRNAILHRSYEISSPMKVYWFSDRVEIFSPGGPFGIVNENNFGELGICDYRNPNLAEAIKNLGYIQRFGVGLPMAKDALEKNGNPELKFSIDNSYISCTIWSRK